MRKNQSSKHANTDSIHQAFLAATGSIGYPMLNDYMFRATLQENKTALQGLIAAALNLQPQDIRSILIKNPIELGKKIEDKTFILDIALELNNDTLLDLELQVANQHNWPERSLSYLCRSFDQLKSGEEYISVKPAIHIGFLAFTPFDDTPEFNATYKMLNVKNHHVYSDKFILRVVDLTHIELATPKDHASGLVYWAQLLLAKTWEDIKMITKNNSYLQQAGETLYTLNEEEMIRQQCQARADFLFMQRSNEAFMTKLKNENAQLISTNKAHVLALAEKDSVIAEKDSAIAEKDSIIAEKEFKLAKMQKTIDELQHYIESQK